MMCLEDVQSQVEESTKSISNEARAQVNSEVNLEQIDLEQHSEQSWSLQQWISYEVQSTTAEEQSHMNQV